MEFVDFDNYILRKQWFFLPADHRFHFFTAPFLVLCLHRLKRHHESTTAIDPHAPLFVAAHKRKRPSLKHKKSPVPKNKGMISKALIFLGRLALGES